jgi:hypothetical protein
MNSEPDSVTLPDPRNDSLASPVIESVVLHAVRGTLKSSWNREPESTARADAIGTEEVGAPDAVGLGAGLTEAVATGDARNADGVGAGDRLPHPAKA